LVEPVKYIKIEKYGRPWHDWFYYDETSPSGLRWKYDRRRGRGRGYVFIEAGMPIGTKTEKGYYVVEVEYETAMVHRIIWEMHNGHLEDYQLIDHMDGDRGNNRLSNLAVKTQDENARNIKMMSTNKTGVCGVHCRYSKGIKKYVATWRNTDKREGTKSFSVNKYGEVDAFRLACEYRLKMIEQLNNQGAGYSERHGTRSEEDETNSSTAGMCGGGSEIQHVEDNRSRRSRENVNA
jgi:hypothetical protein